MLNRLAISTFIALSITAAVQAQPVPGISRYGTLTQPVGNVQLPDSVFLDAGEPGITPPELPQTGQTVQDVLNLSMEDEMRRMWADFNAAVDQNELLQSHSPTVHYGVPTELQQLVNDGVIKLWTDTANRIPQHDDLRQPQALPQDKQFILPFPTGQRGVIQL